MAKETEYKFLCNDLPAKWKPKVLLQGYIHIEKKKQVRVRIDLSKPEAFLCVKYMDGNSRDEYEVPIPIAEAHDLFEKCEYSLTKFRTSYNYEDFHLDVDLYEDGTIIAEVEIKELSIEKLLFYNKLPEFLGENVDGVYRYNNYYFAGLKEEDYK